MQTGVFYETVVFYVARSGNNFMFNKIFARPFIGGDKQSYEKRIKELESQVSTQTAIRNISQAYILAKELEEVKQSADATYFSGRKNNDD